MLELDSFDLRRFLLSQHFLTALRMTVGIALPSSLLMLVFEHELAGLAFAIGALSVSMVDLPGALAQKHREMLGAALLISLSAVLTALAQQYPLLFWPVLLAISFAGAFASAFGPRSAIIGVNMVLVMIIGQAHHGSPQIAAVYLPSLCLGGLCYTYYSLAVCRLLRHQIGQRALAECLFATAEYLERRALCYDPAMPLEACYRQLIAQQVAVVESQQNARGLVLNDLAGRNPHAPPPRRIQLFNLFIDVIDLHDTVLAAQTNFALLRSQFAGSDTLDFLRDSLRKAARDVERIGRAVATGRTSQARYNIKAELHALRYELEIAQAAGLPHSQPDAYAALQTSYQRISRVAELVAKLHQDTHATVNTTGLSIAHVLSRFLVKPKSLFATSFSALPAPALRYALRFTAAMAAATLISRYWLPVGHGNWVLLSVSVILRPGFGLSRQRSQQRILGTLAGCAATLLLLMLVHSKAALFGLMILGLLLSFGLLRTHYFASVFFTSIEILLFYHFLAPGETHVVADRALDTLIGAAIAAVAAYLFPSWEAQLLPAQVKALLRSGQRYLETALSGQEVDELDYRLARRDMLAVLTDLAATYQRMMLEPASKRRAEQAVNELLLQGYLLASQIASLFHLLTQHPQLRGSPVLQQAIAETAALLKTGPRQEPTEPLALPSDAVLGDSLRSLPRTAAEIATLSRAVA
jgi:uncharacterized membrane protein YccC